MRQITYPVRTESLVKYPRIAEVIKSHTKRDRSTLQIVRLLFNDSSGQRVVLEFLERMLGLSEHASFVDQKVRTSGILQFGHNLSELYLLDRLLRFGYNVTTFDDASGNESVPEFLARSPEGKEYIIELYTPHDFEGDELFDRELRQALNYSESKVGFDCRLTAKNVLPPEKGHWSTPYIIKDQLIDRNKRMSVVWKIHDLVVDLALGRDAPHSVTVCDGVVIEIKVDPLPNSDDRGIIIIGATHSTSSELYFDMADCQSKGVYRNIKNKVQKGQLQRPDHPDAVKLLVLDLNGLQDGWILIEAKKDIPSGGELIDSIIFDEADDAVKERDPVIPDTDPSSVLDCDLVEILFEEDKRAIESEETDGMGYYQKRFYLRMRECLEVLVDPSKVDLIVPVCPNIHEHFMVGQTVFNSTLVDPPDFLEATENYSPLK